MRNKSVKIKILSVALIALLMVSLAACGNETGGTGQTAGKQEADKSETVELTATAKLDVVMKQQPYCTVGEYESLNNMAVELFKETARISDEDNLLVSPPSIMMALAMTAQGAGNDTLAQMEKAFDKSTVMFATLMDAYFRTVAGNNETAKVSWANSVWLRDDPDRLSVEDDFIAKSKALGAQVFKSPFDKATVKDINRWCSEHTDGMIESITDEISPDDVIYLINALAYENKWEHQYEKNDVAAGEFTSADGRKKKVDFMYSSEETYLKDDKATGFMKPYKDGFSFVAIMPDEGVTVDEYLAQMDKDTLSNLISGGEETPMVLAGLPKFKSEMSMDLSDALSAMGMSDMFDSEKADFSKMAKSSRGNIFISKVAHKTFIEVDTEGTKAAAVTQVVAADEAAMEMETVVLSRPFIYMIINDSGLESLPLFMGTMEKM